MKLKKENLGGLTSALIELVIGVLLLINPTGFTAGIIVGLGVLLALWGAMSTAPMGKPLAMPLAQVTRSGRTPRCWWAKKRPERP